MYEAQPSSVAFTLTLLLSVLNPVARADGVCTPRDPTAVEKKSYADAYALFLRAAPKAPDGWKSTDHPATGAMPKLCREYGNPPVRRHFDRAFHLERGRQEREDKAVQAYTTQMESPTAPPRGRRSSPLTTIRAIRRMACASFSMAPLSKRE